MHRLKRSWPGQMRRPGGPCLYCRIKVVKTGGMNIEKTKGLCALKLVLLLSWDGLYKEGYINGKK